MTETHPDSPYVRHTVYLVKILSRGTANKWIEWCASQEMIDDALKQAKNAVDCGYTVKIQAECVLIAK